MVFVMPTPVKKLAPTYVARPAKPFRLVFRPLRAAALATLLLAAACASDPVSSGSGVASDRSYRASGAGPAPSRQSRMSRGYDTVGMASWYGGRYHGRTTASGDIFDKNAITAAHRTLPFGSWVQVTNLANGRSMTVKINDRGPFIDGRIIDVSRQVAERLGFIQQGVTRVRVRLVRRIG